MPRYSTLPTLLDDVNQLHLRKLIEWGYIKKESCGVASINWSRGGVKHSSISLYYNFIGENNTLTLNYTCNGKGFEYDVHIHFKPSNLGKGLVPFFVCPKSFKLARKLYLINGLFVHREAYPGMMYESQTRSKSWRILEKKFGAYFDREKCYNQLKSKYFKKIYRNRTTKKYQKILNNLRKSESIDLMEIEKAFLS